MVVVSLNCKQMKKSLLILLLSILSAPAFSQQYKTAIGIKGDWSNLGYDMSQFSVKHFFSEPNAFEINFGASRNNIHLEGLYLYNSPLRNNFDWYAGGGLDVGYFGHTNTGREDTRQSNGFYSGVSGVFGVEHTFDFIPINLALDAGPTIRVIPNFEVGLKVGFAVRYGFGANR